MMRLQAEGIVTEFSSGGGKLTQYFPCQLQHAAAGEPKSPQRIKALPRVSDPIAQSQSTLIGCFGIYAVPAAGRNENRTQCQSKGQFLLLALGRVRKIRQGF